MWIRSIGIGGLATTMTIKELYEVEEKLVVIGDDISKEDKVYIWEGP